MPLLDLLKKKDRTAGNDAHSPRADPEAGPVFTFMRSDTNTQEVISPPNVSSSESSLQPSVSVNKPNNELRTSRLFGGRPRSNSRESGNSGTSGASISSHVSDRSTLKSAHNSKRISERFGLRKHEVGSSHVPSDLPEITVEEAAIGDRDAELQWEKRATILAQQNESRNVDDDLQEAIRLHEEGHLEEATKLFEILADPHGANNALSQVLYGLALRHGWGCQASPVEAVTYLSAAASNAAAIEELALQSGKMKGGAAKGELVIAIYELANCFRNGWGVKKDPTAAQKYYQTAAELGDTDSMNEVARCYLEGFDEADGSFWYRAAYYLRKAENAGVKTLGNSWIWKDKYNPKK
ncbi:uncharacterized protein EAF02_007362 [Botrytis sinoallii]|uniref:uncharacterized protein n=1 Tax=Botrytis sinoallii TaxID=1463999 RepID=UPI001901439A|nr:uncharacterized protein EAF02_007362 [Botrytis sinoallii]KAF7880516.1 hypothetical protein EAF02_007362 [Botrytis sinoallii]